MWCASHKRVFEICRDDKSTFLLFFDHRRQLLADDKADLREFKERFLVGE